MTGCVADVLYHVKYITVTTTEKNQQTLHAQKVKKECQPNQNAVSHKTLGVAMVWLSQAATEYITQ